MKNILIVKEIIQERIISPFIVVNNYRGVV